MKARMTTPKLSANGDSQSRIASQAHKVLLIDDHPIMRQGLAALIDQQSDLKVCGMGENLHEAMSLVASAKPELLVCDISLQGSNGIELLKNIKVHYPDLRVLMLSMHDEGLHAVRALKAGASGYIMKQETTDKI